MGPSEFSINGLFFIKYSMMNFPEDSKEISGTLKFWHPHKTPPWSSPKSFNSYLINFLMSTAYLLCPSPSAMLSNLSPCPNTSTNPGMGIKRNQKSAYSDLTGGGLRPIEQWETDYLVQL